jgi:polyisoprenoid-binding protein YceI
MSVTEQITAVPTGTWAGDPVHSTFEFSVKHMVVATFRGSLPDFDATLTGSQDGSAHLLGVGRLASVVTSDENLTGHLRSPDFFDVERYPEVRYEASDITREGDALVVRGRLTLKGVTRDLELRGSIVGPVVGMGDAEVIGVDLQGVVDRTEYGLTWNAPPPGGGGMVTGDEVTLHTQLELGRA